MKPPPLGLYVHLPWCERKCPYCDFNSHETRKIPEREYVDALLRDLEADLQLVPGRTLETLFIGGGTPSLFSVNSIRRLLGGIGNLIPLSADLEATMEANPGSAEAEKFAGFAEAGINRLSIGVQSFQDPQLQALGRVHNSAQAHAALEYARNAGFESINLDLMHGLPEQTEASALDDLHAALGHKPTHLSWYQLTIEPNTVFYKRPPSLPEEDLLADIQSSGENLLRDAGYRQYEVSAWCMSGFECRHNRNYWTFGDYLGIGAGAHAKLTGAEGTVTRYAKRRQPENYLSARTGNFIADSRLLGEDDIVGEFMMNALRLSGGFTNETFEARTGLKPQTIRERVDSLVERRLLQTAGDRTLPTALGRRYLDSVVEEFF